MGRARVRGQEKGRDPRASAEIPVRFETAPDLVCGIELAANGQKVGWSIADYLTSIERGVEELLKTKDAQYHSTSNKPDSKPEAKKS